MNQNYDRVFNSIREWNDFEKTIQFTHVLFKFQDVNNFYCIAVEIGNENSIKHYYIYGRESK